MQDYMNGFTEVKTCEICEGKGWIMLEKPYYRYMTNSDKTTKRTVTYYNTVYNCICENNHIPQATSLRESNINLQAYEKDFFGKYMARRSV